MWVKDAVSKLKPRRGAKLMVIAASQLPMLAKMKVFYPGLRHPNVLLARLVKQNASR